MSSVRRSGSDRVVTDGIIVGAGVVTAAVAYAPGASTWLLSQGITCPLVRLCGWQCPFCGMTRGTIALLHGDLGEVLRTNPFAIVYVLGLVIMVASVFGYRPRTPVFGNRRLSHLTAVIGLLTFMTYAVTRNLI